MKNICRIFHPMVLGAWVVLDLYVRNFADVTVSDVLFPLLIVPVFALIGYLLVLAVLRKPDPAGLITSFAIVVFFSYGVFYSFANGMADSFGIEATGGHQNVLGNRYLFPPAALFLAIGCILIARIRKDLRGVTSAVNMVSVVLLLFTTARIVFAVVGSSEVSSASSVAHTDPTGKQTTDAEDHPDIYFLIFDRYPNQSTLESVYSFDNQTFLEQLAARGFMVDNHARCNYPRSLASLHATLNMAYHDETVSASFLSRDLRRGHVVARQLLSQGYKYYHLGSWYVPTRENQLADVNMFSFSHGPPGLSEFHVALLKNTLLYPFLDFSLDQENADRHAKIAQFQFASLENFAKQPGPKFVFAHILLPHPPFVFDRDGNRSEKRNAKAAFLDQLHYTNTRITQLIDVIQAESSREPVIILQADEGPYVRGKDRTRPFAEQYQIRAGVLNAWHVPAKYRDKLQIPASTINTFPTLLNLCFGKDYPMLPDRFYAWEGLLDSAFESPGVYHFEEVTSQLED